MCEYYHQTKHASLSWIIHSSVFTKFLIYTQHWVYLNLCLTQRRWDCACHLWAEGFVTFSHVWRLTKEKREQEVAKAEPQHPWRHWRRNRAGEGATWFLCLISSTDGPDAVECTPSVNQNSLCMNDGKKENSLFSTLKPLCLLLILGHFINFLMLSDHPWVTTDKVNKYLMIYHGVN